MIEYKSELLRIENTFREKSLKLIDRLVNKKRLKGGSLSRMFMKGVLRGETD